MTRITVRNKSRVNVRWGGHIFPAGQDKVVEVDDSKIHRIRAQRRLRVVSVGPDASDGKPLWGSTVADAKEYVGTDATRALAVLEAEKERGDKARKSLVEWLQGVIDSDEQSPADESPAGEGS